MGNLIVLRNGQRRCRTCVNLMTRRRRRDLGIPTKEASK